MADEVMDTPELDLGAEEVGQELDSPELEIPEAEQQPLEQPDQAASPSDPYTTKYSREMRAALKALEAQHPNEAKFLKQARDNHARLFALAQLEPKGIDGVRERYTLLDSLALGDAKGIDAVTAMQEQLANVQEVDSLLAQGNPRAFDALGEDFNQGLAKLAPAYLERVKNTDPQAYDAAILPHAVEKFASSGLLKVFNDLVDVLDAKDDPRFDAATKASFTITQLAKMAGIFNDLAKQAGEIKPGAPKIDEERQQFEQERTQFEQERQDIHWKTNIQPITDAHSKTVFDQLFDPYQKRLKLDEAGKQDLYNAYLGSLTRAGKADQAYMRQIGIYRAQRNPDPQAVANFAKNAINKLSKPIMEQLIKARYGPFLNTRPQVAKPNSQMNGRPQPPAGPNVEIRSVKPPMEEIDHRNTPIAWLAEKKYRLYSGKVVQVRQQ
jgi:hypothetical protein